MCARYQGVAIVGKVHGETLIGYDSGLFKAIHALANLNIHPSVGGGNVVEFVLEYYLGRDHSKE
jgi:hypothetical protein